MGFPWGCENGGQILEADEKKGKSENNKTKPMNIKKPVSRLQCSKQVGRLNFLKSKLRKN